MTTRDERERVLVVKERVLTPVVFKDRFLTPLRGFRRELGGFYEGLGWFSK